MKAGLGESGPGGGWDVCAPSLRGGLAGEAEPDWTTLLCTPRIPGAAAPNPFLGGSSYPCPNPLSVSAPLLCLTGGWMF